MSEARSGGAVEVGRPVSDSCCGAGNSLRQIRPYLKLLVRLLSQDGGKSTLPCGSCKRGRGTGMHVDSLEGDSADELITTVRRLSPIQRDVVMAIIDSFSKELVGERCDSDFLTEDAYEYFSMRLAAHHAYSSTVLKKENFEHILEQAFRRTGISASRADSMTERGADLRVGNTMLSLKTEAAKNLRHDRITISKLMEAAWIKGIRSVDDIPPQVAAMVLPHFANYERIFILRSYLDPKRKGAVRYDLREIPKAVLERIGNLGPEDFTPLTRTRTTSAEIMIDGRKAFKFRLDGSDDKLTINDLDVRLCPLHAWWSLTAPN